MTQVPRLWDGVALREGDFPQPPATYSGAPVGDIPPGSPNLSTLIHGRFSRHATPV